MIARGWVHHPPVPCGFSVSVCIEVRLLEHKNVICPLDIRIDKILLCYTGLVEGLLPDIYLSQCCVGLPRHVSGRKRKVQHFCLCHTVPVSLPGGTRGGGFPVCWAIRLPWQHGLGQTIVLPGSCQVPLQRGYHVYHLWGLLDLCPHLGHWEVWHIVLF